MQKYSSWDEIYDAVGIYYELADSESYYAIFTHGTMVKIAPANLHDNEHHFVLTPEHMETWPINRLSPDLTADEVYNDIVEIYHIQSTYDNVGAVAKCAFKILFDNRLQESITPILCTHGDFCIIDFCSGLNVARNGEIDEVVDDAITLRERDLLFPQIYAIITPTELIICS